MLALTIKLNRILYVLLKKVGISWLSNIKMTTKLTGKYDCPLN